jgi:hypothetical protein
VTSREENNALQNLVDLLASDLTTADQETLIAGVKDSEWTHDQTAEWTGKLVAELKRRGDLSWPALARLTGVPHPTLIRRARPYLPPSATDETP